MVLEACFVCIDNSEWMRNGDYIPTRWDAQKDTLNMVCGSKIQQNPENSVGVIAMAGRRVNVVLALSTDIGKIMSELQAIQIQGACDFLSSLKIAQLGLKHRANKHQRQRIVMFVGSPVRDDEKLLIQVGKKLKKNNIGLDIISFGNPANNDKLTKLVETVESSDNSHFIYIEGGSVMSDVVLTSNLVQEGFDDGGASGAAGGAAGGMSHEFGIDPSVDPELAMALRISMEEERARQERDQGDEPSGENKEGAEGTAAADSGEKKEEGASGEGADGSKMEVSKEEPDFDNMNEEELLQHALALSTTVESAGNEVAATDAEKKGEEAKDDGAADPKFEDASFVKGLLEDLPGVNMDDPDIQNALKGLDDKKEDEDKDKKEGEGDK